MNGVIGPIKRNRTVCKNIHKQESENEHQNSECELTTDENNNPNKNGINLNKPKHKVISKKPNIKSRPISEAE